MALSTSCDQVYHTCLKATGQSPTGWNLHLCVWLYLHNFWVHCLRPFLMSRMCLLPHVCRTRIPFTVRLLIVSSTTNRSVFTSRQPAEVKLSFSHYHCQNSKPNSFMSERLFRRHAQVQPWQKIPFKVSLTSKFHSANCKRDPEKRQNFCFLSMAFLFSLCFAFWTQSPFEAQASLELDILPHCVDLYFILLFTMN